MSIDHLRRRYITVDNVIFVDTLRPRNPRCCQVDACFQPGRSFGSVDPAKDVRTHPPMVLLVIAQKIKLLPFYWDISLTFFFVWRLFYIMSEVLLPSLIVGRLFVLSWCPQGGDKVIITLQSAVRTRGRWLAIAPVFSLCRQRNVGCDSSLQLMIRAIYSDRIKHRPGMIFESVVCPPWGTRIEVRVTCSLGGYG